jgi:hypothetical protein
VLRGETNSDARSGEFSERIVPACSNNPVAFALDDPTAGAALLTSPGPTCSRCIARKAEEFAVDTTESVGLPGLSIGGVKSGTSVMWSNTEDGAADVVDAYRGRGDLGAALSVLVVPLMVANRLRRSSKGAPLPASTLFRRLLSRGEEGKPAPAISDILRWGRTARGERDSMRLFKNTVWGMTLSF